MISITVCAAFWFITSASISRAEDSKIEEVMKNTFKGDNSLYKKVATGRGTADDNAKLATIIKGLAGTMPPKGDIEKWKQKITDLIKAADDVAAGKPNGLIDLQMSGKCKVCHSEHKEHK